LAYYFATHPYPEERVATLQQQIQEKGYAVGERLPLDERLKTVSSIQKDVSLKEILSR
jgi:predicted Zn-dependent protease